ncbi:DUF4124 domain-containing protein [Polaromonas sp.]|uniref:DUF4124 domain-containing protein n=1 Tax=Polaromonas sp. TaxID=1869339 RepID=UPI003453D7CB
MSFAFAARAQRQKYSGACPEKQLCFKWLENFSARRYTAPMDLKVVPKKLLLALAAASLSISAWAQWQWIDKDGRKVFSDRPPPADIQQKNILKRSGPDSRPTVAPAVSGLTAPAVAAGKASAPKLPGKDPQLEARKKQAEEAEAARKKAEEEQIAKTRAENCERTKRGLASFESGVRIAVTNAQGEREIMDDAARAAEKKRLQGIASSECKL